MHTRVDKGSRLSKIEELKAELEKFKRIQKSEIELGPIERWMTKELGVERLSSKKSKGSIIKYRHLAFKTPENPEGHFVIHKMHKKREMIRRSNFHEFLAKRLETILAYLETEVNSENAQ